MSWISVVGHVCIGIDNALDSFDVAEGPFTWWFCYISMTQKHLRGHVSWPPAEFYDHLVGTNSGRWDDATAPSVTH